MRVYVLRILFLFSSVLDANGFLAPGPSRVDFLRLPSPKPVTTTTNLRHSSFKVQLFPEAVDSLAVATTTFHLSAVEVFDGSSIVDPVVVSNNFWSSLERQLVSVILGQFLASIVFGIAVSLLAPQLSKIRDSIMEKFTDREDGSGNAEPRKAFVKADSIARQDPDFGKLLVCLLIDIIGTSSEALPIVGEFTDVLTAPAAALILQNLYPGSSKFIFVVEFAEEILPLTDFIPFATICWVVDTYYPGSTIAEVFQLGNYNGSAVTETEKAESMDVTGKRIYDISDSDTNQTR